MSEEAIAINPWMMLPFGILLAMIALALEVAYLLSNHKFNSYVLPILIIIWLFFIRN